MSDPTPPPASPVRDSPRPAGPGGRGTGAEDPGALPPELAPPELEAAVREAGCGVFWLDDELRVRRGNAAFARFCGRSEAELPGTPIAELDPGWPHGERADALPALRTKTSAGHATHLLRPGREPLPVQLHLNYLSLGGLESLFGVAVDVSDRQSVEDALRVSEARYRAVTEQQTEFIIRFEPGDDRTVTFCNAAFARLVDFGEIGDVVGKPMPEYVHPDDRQLVADRIGSLTPENPLAAGENRVLGPRGEVLWTSWVNRGIFADGSDGGPPRLVEVQSVGRDVTERRETERRLAQSERRLRAALDDMEEMVVRWCPDGRVYTFANAAFCRARGLPEDEVVGRAKVLRWVEEGARPGIREMMARVTPEDPGGQALVPIVAPDGSTRWEEWSGQAIYADPDDPAAAPKLLEFQCVGRDVTDQIAAESRRRDREAAVEKLKSLSPRELEVLAAVAEGTTNKVIARRLGITERTIEKHRSSAMHKLGVRSAAELVRIVFAAEQAVPPSPDELPPERAADVP